MGRRIDSAELEQRREWVRKQVESGLSAARFCRENALNPNCFHTWKRDLLETPSKAARTNSKRTTPKSVAIDSVAIDSVAIESRDGSKQPSSFLQIPVSIPSSPTWVEVSMADGIVVRVPAANLAALKLVLASLKSDREGAYA